MKLSDITGSRRLIVETAYEAALTDAAREEDDYDLAPGEPTTLRRIVEDARKLAGDGETPAAAEILVHEATGRWKYDPDDGRLRAILDEPIAVYEGFTTEVPRERCTVYVPSYWQ